MLEMLTGKKIIFSFFVNNTIFLMVWALDLVGEATGQLNGCCEVAFLFLFVQQECLYVLI